MFKLNFSCSDLFRFRRTSAFVLYISTILYEIFFQFTSYFRFTECTNTDALIILFEIYLLFCLSTQAIIGLFVLFESLLRQISPDLWFHLQEIQVQP